MLQAQPPSAIAQALPVPLAPDSPPTPVTLGLIDGSELCGGLVSFSPQLFDLELRPTDAEPGTPRRRFVPGERVAYVGFLEASASDPESEVRGKQLRVNVASGRVFRVEVEESSLSSPLGFFGAPIEQGTGFERIFFYAHGVIAKQDDTPVGELLVERGLLNREDLDRGLAVLNAEKEIKLGDILIERHKVDPLAVEKAVDLQQRRRVRIGELLVEAGCVNGEQLNHALAEQRARKGKKLGEVLIELGLVSEEALSATLASKFLMPLVRLDETPPEAAALTEISRDLIEKYGVLPIRVSASCITVAIPDPLAIETIEAVRNHARKRVEEVLVVPSELRRHVTQHLARLDAERARSGLNVLVEELGREVRAKTPAPVAEEEITETDSALIRLVNQLVFDCYRRGASDIHIEPNGEDGSVLVRVRIDGECVPYQELPASLRKALVSRIKIMARLDIAERRKPQDGKIRMQTPRGPIELRVATMPTVGGNEDVVLRILASSRPLRVDALCLSPGNLQRLQQLSAKPYGLLLVVGPTGSGKTTTLHSVLGQLNDGKKKIWTAEDPVEIVQPGLRQVQVQSRIGFTFAAALRSFLRADPDVIMVGEMRDAETAAIAVESSLTGHLVLSTLHTNSAPETITRLVDMGLDAFSFSDALLGVLAQRLVKTLCPLCKEPYVGTRAQYEELRHAYGAESFDDDVGLEYGPDFRLCRSVGCEACAQKGYKGRAGVHELLVADDDIRKAITTRGSVQQIRELAVQAGMTTLLQDGIKKVLLGMTDLKQVLAVCSR